MGLIYSQGGRLGDDSGGLNTPDEFEAQGVSYTDRRPCMVWFRGDLYVIGSYTRPIVRHAGDAGRWRIAGIKPPTMKLVVVPGASTGGSTGACLAAITFLHKSGGVVYAESNFSNVVDVGALTGEGRAWSNIDNVTAENRVTHVRGYVSMEGSDFRACWESPYGVTAYIENVRTIQLTYAGPEGYNHGIPPSTRFGHTWMGRMWYGHSEQFPYRVWRSEPGYPQYVDAANFLDTTDREAITAIWKGRNEFLIFGIRNAYMVRQLTDGGSDFVIEKLDSDVGCISQFGICEIHNKLWFPSEDGIWIYDGSFRYLMKEVQPFWKVDWDANKAAHLDGFAMHDRINKIYMWVTRRSPAVEIENTDLVPSTVTYCGYYGAFEPSMAGDQPHPEWTLDLKGRLDSCGFYNENGELIIGSCDGKLRIQDWTDDDDDGDTLRKTAIVRTGHKLFNETGDDWESGKKLLQLWSYVESEQSAWAIYVRGGDEQVWKSILPDNEHQGWKASVAASAKSETRKVKLWSGVERTLALEYVPQTGHFFLPQQCTGQGFTFELRAVAPVGLEYRGLGGMWGPGPSSTRLIKNYTNGAITLEWSLDNGATWTAFPCYDNSAGPWSLQVRATLAYAYGAAAFPIPVVFTVSSTAEEYLETVVLAGPGLAAIGGTGPSPCPCPPGTDPPWTFAALVGPFAFCLGTVVVTAVDAHGVILASATGVFELTVPV